jgi:hypothetical protein
MRRLVDVAGSESLVARLRVPLHDALADRRTFYAVEVEAIGRTGEVLVAITSSKGRVPLLLRQDQLEPGCVCQLVRDSVSRSGL